MVERKKILWLVSWYPNKYDAFDGDFIQRHAMGAAMHDDIHVIFVKQHEAQNAIQKESDEKEGFTEEIIYLPKNNAALSKVKNHSHWKKAYRDAVCSYIETCRPSVIHVHIPWKVGLIGMWAKKKFHIPYIITEHWGIYNNVVEDNIHTKSFVILYILKRIYKEASAFVSVSKYLGEGVNETLLKKEYSVIPNVVDRSLFFPVNEKHSRFTFLHVSNMVPLKNVEGILEAFSQFLQAGADAQMILIGNRDHQYEQLADKLELLGTSVFFKGEIPYAEVAKEMQRSHVFILNSNIENSPCVIGEALCCGLPVIATNAGGVPELVHHQNGLLISSKDEKALEDAMMQVYRNYDRYKPDEIALAAKQKFSFETVGQQLYSLYRSNNLF